MHNSMVSLVKDVISVLTIDTVKLSEKIVLSPKPISFI